MRTLNSPSPLKPITLTRTWRRHGAIALLAFTLCAHGPAHALDLPGAAPQAAQPAPDYRPQRLNEIFATDKHRPMAKQWVRTDKLDKHLEALRLHAGNPALRFNSEEQQAQAQRDALQLAISLAQVTASADIGPPLLLRAAIALSVARNLGAPEETAALADERFQRLLARLPDLPQGLHEYGIHLANTQRFDEALVPLRHALALGDESARWPLAMSLAALGQRSEAVAELEALQARSAEAARRYPLVDTLATLRSAPG